VYRKYNVVRHIAFDVPGTLTTLLVIVVAVSASSGDRIEDSDGGMAPEGGGFGVAMSSSPSSKSSSAASLPNALGPMSNDSRSSSIGATFKTLLKADLW